MLNVKQESWEYQFLSNWFDLNRIEPESTASEADILITRPCELHLNEPIFVLHIRDVPQGKLLGLAE